MSEFHSWSKILLHSCGDAPWKDPVKGLFHGNFASPLGVGQLYPLGYSPAPLLLGLPRGGSETWLFWAMPREEIGLPSEVEVDTPP